MNLPIIDIIILVIILASAVWGIFKGFVSQIVSILALIIGSWCAYKFSNYASKEIIETFSLTINPATLQVIMFIIILIIVLLLGALLARALEGVIKLSMLEWLNRLLGFIFAALKTIIILSLIVYILESLNGTWNIIPKETLNASKSYQILTNFSAKLFPYLQHILK